jgi:protoporphyrin/coproporphyrin ferrochelatase
VSKEIDAVVLLGFGGPNAPDEIRPFLDRVLRGRPVPPARYEEVVAHYQRVGGRSPYNALTQRQADALAQRLQERGFPIPVVVAYRNASPFIGDALPDLLERSIGRAFAIPLSAFGGPAGADRYIGDAQAALRERGGPQLVFAPAYFEEPLFLEAHAARIREALSDGALSLSDAMLLFSAHSVPISMSDPYVAQLELSARGVAARLDAPAWQLVYQSRSGRPEDAWLEPDVRDALRERKGVQTVVLAPLGFLSDHVEILYDLDVEAAEVAEECGILVRRVSALNDHPLFIEMLAELVLRSR